MPLGVAAGVFLQACPYNVSRTQKLAGYAVWYGDLCYLTQRRRRTLESRSPPANFSTQDAS
jgi:hypothetical protein